MDAYEWMEQNYRNQLNDGESLDFNSDLLFKIMEEYHQSKVENLGLFDVRQQRELLINFLKDFEPTEAIEEGWDNSDYEGAVDNYLKRNLNNKTKL